MSLISSTKFNHHTLIVSQKDHVITGVIFEKDWWNYQFAQNYAWRMLVQRENEIYHLVGDNLKITTPQCDRIVDNVRSGNIQVVDLREYSARVFSSRKKK